MPANPHKTWKNIIGTTSAATANANTTNTNTYLNHVEDGNVTSSLRIQWTSWVSVSAQNGTLTISGTVGTTTYTADSGLTLASNVFKANLKSYTKSTNAAIDWWTDANKQYAVSLDKDGKLSVNVPREAWNGWDGLTVSWTTNNGYCKYIGGVTLSTLWWGSDGGEGYIQYTDTNAWWGDSHWKSTLSWNSRYYLQPNLTNGTYRVELYPWSSTTTHGAASKIVFDSKWIRINNWAQFYTWAWLAVGWNIMVWQTSTDNYIYIYATWNNNDSNKRFEIFWNNELVLWTTSGSYLYFAQRSWTVGFRLGVNTSNPKATLDVKWWIRVGNNCEQRTCTGSNVWTIVYTSDMFLGCKKISWTTYKRVSLDGWTRSGTNLLSFSNCVLSEYNSNGTLYNGQTQAEY